MRTLNNSLDLWHFCVLGVVVFGMIVTSFPQRNNKTAQHCSGFGGTWSQRFWTSKSTFGLSVYVDVTRGSTDS